MAKILKFWRKPAPSAHAVLEQHLSELYQMAFRLTGNASDSEDLLQELVAKLLARPESLENLNSPRPWLKRALYNLFVDGYRRSHLRPLSFSELNSDSDHDFADLQPSARDGPESEYQRQQLREQLIYALDQLPHNQRELIVLHDVAGNPLTELEYILQQPLGTLKSRLHRARRQLRKILADATF